LLDNKGIFWRMITYHSQCSGGGHHFIAGVDIVFDQYRYAVQWPTYFAIFTFFIQTIGNA